MKVVGRIYSHAALHIMWAGWKNFQIGWPDKVGRACLTEVRAYQFYFGPISVIVYRARNGIT